MRHLAFACLAVVGLAAATAPALAQRPAPIPLPAPGRPGLPAPQVAGTRLPGEYRIHHFLMKANVSLSRGTVTLVPSLGPDERLHLTKTASGATAIQGPDGTIVYGDEHPVVIDTLHTDPGTAQARLGVLAAGDTSWQWAFHETFAPGETYDTGYEIHLHSRPILEITTGYGNAKFFLESPDQAWAPALFKITKCGEIGSGQAYIAFPVGQRWRWLPPAKFFRHSDGLYDFQTLTTPPKYVSAAGGGGYANDHDAPGGHVITLETTSSPATQHFRVVDQGDCTYAIQTEKQFYLGVKNGTRDVYTSRVSDPKAAPSVGYTALFELVPTDL